MDRLIKWRIGYISLKNRIKTIDLRECKLAIIKLRNGWKQ
jgi:hypothetical protein